MKQKKDGYRLKEYVSALKTAYELAIPVSLDSARSFDAKKNLFDHCPHDLEALIGHAVIIPFQHQRVHERSMEDDLLISLHPFYGMENDEPENLEKRLQKLFAIKDKWTAKEIQTFMIDFCDPDVSSKFDVWLAKNTRQLKEPNPYDPKVNQ